MKTIFFSTAIALFMCSSLSTVNAQNDLTSIFQTAVSDVNKVADGYIKPAGNSFASGLGSNWYNTAEVHKAWGFDVNFGVGAVMAPKEDQMFDISGLSILKRTNTSLNEAPSFVGTGAGVELNLMQPEFFSNGTPNPEYKGGTGKIISLTTPSGISKVVPTASIQVTLGIPYINDVSFRLVPTVKVGGFETSLWGIGIKHNFKQWIPVFSALPFDAAVVLAYSKFDMKYAFPAASQITPDMLVSGKVQYIPDPTSSDYSKQGMKMSAEATTANLIVSKNFAFITPYCGIGITKTTFDMALAGNYPTLTGDPQYSLADQTFKVQVKNITDPVKISSSEMMPNATIGLRAKFLWLVSFHAQYTFQKYPTATAGFGFTFR